MKNLNLITIGLLLLLTWGCNEEEEEKTISFNSGPTNNIMQYLAQEAKILSNKFPTNTISLEDWETLRPKKHKQFIEMMGFDMEEKRLPPKVYATDTLQQEGFRIEKFYYESLPDLFVPANLYVPDNITNPRATIVYLSGHSHGQKANYQAHARRLAELGFITLIFDTIQFGEVWGHHWGPYNKGWFNWYSRGYNPAAVELWNAIRGLDYLETRTDVDMDNIGITGISGGGSQSWYFAAADSRVKAAAPVCGAGTMDSQVGERRIDGHCDCMMINNGFQMDYTDIGALIAPKPLLIAQSDRDELYGIESTRQFYQTLSNFYKKFDAENNISLVETPGGHSYHPKSRKAIFSFFLHHLMGKEIPAEEIMDIETNKEKLLPTNSLNVYKGSPPATDITKTIQHSFVKTAEIPVINSQEALKNHQNKVKEYLKSRTFGAFPNSAIDLGGKMIYRTADLAKHGNKTYSFNSEEGWELKVNIFYRQPQDEKSPLLLVLRTPGEERWESEGYANKVPGKHNIAYLEVRGVGEAGWAPELNWHVRRSAAWLGKTIASMQIYDTMRALEFCRTLPEVNPDQISILGRDGMASIAMYAALMDEKCEGIYLSNPPETHDHPSPKNGRDFALELLNVLRITDTYQLPALIHPTKTYFLSEIPPAYNWSNTVLKEAVNEQLQIIN
ncbi:prolyl oligopeptidase family serine peptidase [Cyclobacterium sp. 1_MG-2023]|uniref:alpha/beta hydrolase n=1 Tax=Cyclobacterium sp. 1_MG-2023 TaxID=3062681 RepID=UPI0026E37A18|nr:prolyl oligopeptidase family serine peptidase [Cyclobacterium sp. 1_MG-2023]MDO6437406.1 prolyl oligopeptidase family serine peptidase [Cyclobacterium sp. 1_MG-2023]